MTRALDTYISARAIYIPISTVKLRNPIAPVTPTEYLYTSDIKCLICTRAQTSSALIIYTRRGGKVSIFVAIYACAPTRARSLHSEFSWARGQPVLWENAWERERKRVTKPSGISRSKRALVSGARHTAQVYTSHCATAGQRSRATFFSVASSLLSWRCGCSDSRVTVGKVVNVAGARIFEVLK